MTSKIVGQKIIALFITIGLITASLIMIWFSSSYENPFRDFVNFVADFHLNLLVGVIVLYIAGYYLGGLAGLQIIDKKRNPTLIGIIVSIIILLIGTLFGSLVGFLEERFSSIPGLVSNAAFDYLVKPLYWIFFIGIIPVIILGTILGQIIKRKKTF